MDNGKFFLPFKGILNHASSALNKASSHNSRCYLLLSKLRLAQTHLWRSLRPHKPPHIPSSSGEAQCPFLATRYIHWLSRVRLSKFTHQITGISFLCLSAFPLFFWGFRSKQRQSYFIWLLLLIRWENSKLLLFKVKIYPIPKLYQTRFMKLDSKLHLHPPQFSHYRKFSWMLAGSVEQRSLQHRGCGKRGKLVKLAPPKVEAPFAWIRTS